MSTVLASDYIRWPGNSQPIEKGLESSWSQAVDTDSITIDIENLLGRLQEQQVQLINIDAIRGYMRGHSDIVSGVDIVTSLVRSHFGEDVQLLLDVYNDPEIDDQYLQLRVRAADYNSEFMDLIDAVDTLTGPILQHGIGRILLTTDFVPIH